MKNVSIVTGGAGGMGYATATILAKYGPVMLFDVNEDALKNAVATMEKQNMEVYYHVVDVSDEEQVKAGIAHALEIGDIKKVFHVAGVSPIIFGDASGGMISAEYAHRMIDINAIGTLNLVENLYPVLKEGAAVVTVTSNAVFINPHPFTPETAEAYAYKGDKEELRQRLYGMCHDMVGYSYCISKIFVRQYTEANALRFGLKGCRINSLAPGRIATRLHLALVENSPGMYESDMATTPLRRYGRAYEVGQLVEFLCSENAAYINGTMINIDGGFLAQDKVPQLPV